MKYAVIQKSSKSVLIGIGNTKWAAIEDANHYVEKTLVDAEEYAGKDNAEGYEPAFDISGTHHYPKIDGAMYVVGCSDKLYEQVEAGHECVFCGEDDGFIYLPNEEEEN